MNKPIEIKAASERHPEFFKVTDSIINECHELINLKGFRPPTTALAYVKIATIIRAYNIYISINILLKTDHWEEAAIIARTLFELVLNLEEVIREKEKSESNARKFLRFSCLQESLHLLRNVEYEIANNKCSDERKGLAKDLEGLTSELFAEFQINNNYLRYWCGKSVYKLAAESSNPLRISQYKIIYSYCSDLIHGSPFSVMTTWVPLDKKMSELENIENKNKSEEKNILEIIMLSTTWLTEVLFLGQSEFVEFDLKIILENFNKIYDLIGIKPPYLRKSVR